MLLWHLSINLVTVQVAEKLHVSKKSGMMFLPTDSWLSCLIRVLLLPHFVHNMKKYTQPLIVFALLFSFGVAGAQSVDNLITAVIRNSDRAMKKQLALTSNPNARDAKGRTALTLAIAENSDRVIPLLLQAPSVDINATNKQGESPLMLAIIRGKENLARQLLQRGAAANKHGWSPLHYAATVGNVDMMRVLLEKGAYIDSQSPNETTPLMMAARYSSNALAVQHLLKAGADPWVKNQLGLTALDFAQQGKNADSIHAIQTAQSRSKPNYNVKPLTPLTPEEVARLKGLPYPPVADDDIDDDELGDNRDKDKDDDGDDKNDDSNDD